MTQLDRIEQAIQGMTQAILATNKELLALAERMIEEDEPEGMDLDGNPMPLERSESDEL